MKRYFKSFLIISTSIMAAWGCSEGNYPGGEVSPYIGVFDVRNIYKNQPVKLNEQTLDGSSKIAVLVTSDHSGNNLPEGLVFVQDARRLNALRGLALNLGAEAKNYLPGDSIIVDVNGGTLNRVNGILQVSDIQAQQVNKVASGLPVVAQRVNVAQLMANPNNYESTLSIIVKGSFNPIPSSDATLAGNWTLNDGFGNIQLVTDSKATVANNKLLRMGNYAGIVLNKLEGDSLVPYLKTRVENDVVALNSVYSTPKVIITGWSNDPAGSDSNYEYIQLMATEDIDFSKTPFAVVTSNNAGASTPTGVPAKGWATGGMRTYKFNLTSGTAKKGEFFYVGGTNKMINGPSSTKIDGANWITAYEYNTKDGFDGIGTKTSNLLANSGNAYGIAVFSTKDVTVNSIPEDVMFVATGGTLVSATAGYRIANNDFYDVINPITLVAQPFYRSGANTLSLTYNTPSDAGYFNMLGGAFDMTLGRWVKARSKYTPLLTKESKLEDIENPTFSTKLVN